MSAETVSLKKIRDEASRETAKAFGGCTKCYGKGYATQIENITTHADFEGDQTFSMPVFPYKPCRSCDRGKQIVKMLETAGRYFEQALRDVLPEFIDEEFPKGASADRGAATTHIALFLSWLKTHDALQ